MRGYISYFKSELLVGLQYKTAAIAGLSTQFFWGFIYALVYIAFYRFNNIDSINIGELMCYVWLNQSFIRLVYLEDDEDSIVDEIKSGTVSYELCKPYDLYNWWYLKLLAKRYAETLLRFLPILVVSFILPKPYNLSLPASPLYFIMFLLTLFLGSLLIVSINMIVKTIGFYTGNNKGIQSIVISVGSLFSGLYIPLPLMPNFVLKIANVLPFRFIGDLPFRLYSSNIDYKNGLECILIQILWIIIMLIIGRLFMRFALKKVTILGG